MSQDGKNGKRVRDSKEAEPEEARSSDAQRLAGDDGVLGLDASRSLTRPALREPCEDHFV